MTGALYDSIGRTYGEYRRPDPRIAAMIDEAVGATSRIVNVGSGTGSYEPRRPRSVAVEPAKTMIAQRPPDAVPVVQAVAESLPFADDSFDVALASLTIHHWTDPVQGIRELVRVAPRQVIFTWKPDVAEEFWLITDYIPSYPRGEAGVATLAFVEEVLEVREVRTVPVPWDCTDGFLGAYWRRPEMYLDAGARQAISGFSWCDPDVVTAAMDLLRRDIADGTWAKRHADLFETDEIDLGYRLVVADGKT